MSVYIKGLKMPESCDRCFVKFCEGRAKEERISVQRHESCPLVPVSDHGRLIDGDELQTEGWTIQRIFQSSPLEMTWETKNPLDFPIVIPADKEGE